MEIVKDIDHLLPFIGELGRYQAIIIAILSLAMVPCTYQALIIYFVAYNPPWQCSTNSTVCNMTGIIKSSDSDLYKKRCDMDRHDWEFSEDKYFSIATQFDLYCGRESYIFIANSMFFAGSVIGSILMGWLSDKYGRMKVMIPSCVVVFAVAFASSFSGSYWGFTATRFIIGVLGPGTGVLMFVLASEIVSTKYRPLTGIVLWLWFTLALVIMGVKAMFVREWKMLMIYCTAPYFVVVILLWFVPESMRWLHVTGKNEKVMEIAQKVAQFNKKPQLQVKLAAVSESTVSHQINPLLLFRNWKVALTSLNIGFAWFVNGLVYYGVAIAVDDLSGNMYRDYILGSLVEFPAAVAAILCSMYVGRKPTVQIPLLIGGIFCAVVSAIPENKSKTYTDLRVAFGMLGKFFITTSYDAIYTWTIELYPTQIRSEGIGFVQITSKLGAALAPWVAKYLRQFHVVIPYALMGILAVVASIFLQVLPETRGTETAETVTDQNGSMPVPEEKEMIVHSAADGDSEVIA